MIKGLSDINAVESAKVYINSKGNRYDISNMITSINIQESITGDLVGMLEVKDTAGVIDNLIITGDEIINISFTYFKLEVNLSFYLNGIGNINAVDQIHSKTYTIELASINDYISSTNLLAMSLNGLATDIIGTIFMQFFDHNGLFTSTESKNQGRYIVPNISPKRAIATILSKACDKNNSKILMFQKLIANGDTFMESLFDLTQRDAVYKLSPATIVASDVDEAGPSKLQIGRPAHIIINDNTNLINKSASGDRGKTIDFINLSQSQTEREVFRGNSNPAINKVIPFRNNMYDNSVSPLINGDNESDNSEAKFQKVIMGSIVATAYDCPAVPGLSVGSVVELELDDRRETKVNTPKMLSNKYSDTWLVTGINHRISAGMYTQNITLSKGIIES